MGHMANVTLNSKRGDQHIFLAVEHGQGCSEVQVYVDGEELNVVVSASARAATVVTVNDEDVYQRG